MDVDSVVKGGVKVVREVDSAPVSGSWSAARGNTLFRFIPSGDLDPQTTYRVLVTTAVRSEGGVALGNEKSIVFRTVSSDEAAAIIAGQRK